jgi:hypothetical protein
LSALVWKAILDDDVVVYHLSGSVSTVGDTVTICRQLADALSEGLTKVVLDCSELAWAGNTLAGLILASMQQIRIAGGQLHVVEGPLQLGTLQGLAPDALRLHRTLPQALACMEAPTM